MHVHAPNILILTVLVLREVCEGTILCYRCHMKENPQCEEKPQDAQPCFDPGDGIPQTCSIIRTYDAGQQIDFRRSCSNSMKSGCIDEPKSGHKICAQICTTDYCNGPSASPAFLCRPWLLLSAAVVAKLFVQA